MKNVQIIDGAENSEYAIYSFADDQFAMVFPEDGQDIEFIEDLVERLSPENAKQAFAGVWSRRVDKKCVAGIHGTLFYELRDRKRGYYPTKRESDLR